MLSEELPDGFLETTTLSVDLETTSNYGRISDPFRDDVLLISLCNDEKTIVLQPGAWVSKLFAVLEDAGVRKPFQNAKFDLKFLHKLGFDGHPVNLWDTMLAEQVLTAGLKESVSLAAIAWRRINKMLNKEVRETFFHHGGEFSEEQLRYSMMDAEVLIPIMRQQWTRLEANGLMETADLENNLVPIVTDMELRGICFDVDSWDTLKREELDEAEQQEQLVLPQLLGYQVDLLSGKAIGNINLNSPDQVKAALHKIGIKVPNTQAETYLKHAEKHPETASLLKSLIMYKQCLKRIGYNYPKYIHPVTDRIHTDYGQNFTATGRFRSAKPNLQNVTRLQSYRSLFVAASNYMLITADYSQQEMRILAQASGDKNLADACQKGIHLVHGRWFYQDETMQKTDPRRFLAKTAGFGAVYAASAELLAQILGLSIERATELVTEIKRRYRVANMWAREMIAEAERTGYTTTLGGRRRYYPPQQESWATEMRNCPIQSTAADMTKRAMVYVAEALRKGGYDAHLVLTVHDELVTEVHKDQASEVKVVIERQMERAGKYYVPDIPMPVDAVISKDWRK